MLFIIMGACPVEPIFEGMLQRTSIHGGAACGRIPQLGSIQESTLNTLRNTLKTSFIQIAVI